MIDDCCLMIEGSASLSPNCKVYEPEAGNLNSHFSIDLPSDLCLLPLAPCPLLFTLSSLLYAISSMLFALSSLPFVP
jgi:hypothetical protein